MDENEDDDLAIAEWREGLSYLGISATTAFVMEKRGELAVLRRPKRGFTWGYLRRFQRARQEAAEAATEARRKAYLAGFKATKRSRARNARQVEA